MRHGDEPMLCSVRVETRGDDLVILVEGELDERSGRTLTMVVDAVTREEVGLDLSGLTFLDARGYYAIQRALTRPECAVTIARTNRWYDRLDDLVREGPL